jgi:hypothetical protein
MFEQFEYLIGHVGPEPFTIARNPNRQKIVEIRSPYHCPQLPKKISFFIIFFLQGEAWA